MNMMVALGLAQVTQVVGIDMTYDKVSCTVIAVFLHLFYTSTFTWMLCEGVQLYLKIIAVFNSEKKSYRVLYYLLGWGKDCLLFLFCDSLIEDCLLFSTYDSLIVVFLKIQSNIIQYVGSAEIRLAKVTILFHVKKFSLLLQL